MSLPIWTPDALRSEARQFTGTAWRFVEAQHVISTRKLVNNNVEQEELERILEESKPTLPDDCRNLNFLLFTPFRYRPYPNGSRFRRTQSTHGVWYGAERPETAAAEMVFYRFLFYAESPNTPFPVDAAKYTAFSANIKTLAAIDLTEPALVHDNKHWTHLTDYGACQQLAETVRKIEGEVIRYYSVRDPKKGANIAVLSCRAFARSKPVDLQTWHIQIGKTGAQVVCEHPKMTLKFMPDAFAPDPRLEGMNWERPRAE